MSEDSFFNLKKVDGPLKATPKTFHLKSNSGVQLSVSVGVREDMYPYMYVYM